LRKFHDAKTGGADTVAIWGSGTPLREFLHVDDCAAGIALCLDDYDGDEHINCGSGAEISIIDLALLIKEVVGFDGGLVLDQSKPDGTPRKVMDSSRLNALGWEPKISLPEGLAETYRWFIAR